MEDLPVWAPDASTVICSPTTFNTGAALARSTIIGSGMGGLTFPHPRSQPRQGLRSLGVERTANSGLTIPLE
jgi:hypothetical protein